MSPRPGQLLVLLGFALLLAAAPPTAAQDRNVATVAPDTLVPGAGPSAWGPIAPPDTTNTAPGHDYRRRTWENVLHYPYQIIGIPLWLVGQGLGGVVAWTTESTAANRIINVATLKFLPFDSSIGVTAGGDDGLGISYTGDTKEAWNPNHRIRLALRYTTRQNSKATLGMAFNEDRATVPSLGIGYRLKPDTRFYGLGYASTADQLSYYTTETAWAAGGVRRDLGGGGFAELMARYTSVATRGPREGEEPHLEDRYPDPDDRPFGYGERSEGLGLTLALGRNTAHNTGRPQHGNLLRGFVSYFEATDATDVNFWSWRLEAQQFLPLWHTRRGLALRGYVSRIRNLGDDPVPFQRLLLNNEPDLLRGYKDFRFRDSGLLGATIEYRFPVWNFSTLDDTGVDAYLFADWGQVFASSNEVALANLTQSLGVGWRAITTEDFMIRFEIGWSDEETVFRITGEQMFQWKKGGVVHGRSPVPVR